MRGDSAERDPSDIVAVELTDDEWYLLRTGLFEWSGAARATDALVEAMGYASFDDFDAQRQRICVALDQSEPLSRFDWARALVATELVFVSAIFGSDRDWQSATRFTDEETLPLLRALQRN